jgi:hypothetical protein
MQDMLDLFLATCNWGQFCFGWCSNLTDEANPCLIEPDVAAQASPIFTGTACPLTGSELQFPWIRILGPDTFVSEWKT